MTDILRIIGGGLLCLICCYVGLIVKKRYSARAEFYACAVDFATLVAREISLHKTPIPAIVKEYVGTIAQGKNTGGKCEFVAVLNDAFHCENADLKKVENSKIAVKSSEKNLLKNAEIQELKKFLSALGKTTLSDQLEMVNGYKKMFEESRDRCESECKKLGGMYFKLCVLLGIALMLIVM